MLPFRLGRIRSLAQTGTVTAIGSPHGTADLLTLPPARDRERTASLSRLLRSNVMRNLAGRLWCDETGVILSSELVIVGTVLVIGVVSGTACLRNAVDGELRDLGHAIGSLDQSYSFSGHNKLGHGDRCCAWTAGSAWLNCTDRDLCDGDLAGCVPTVSIAESGSHGCRSCGQSGCGGCEAPRRCGSCGGAAPCGQCGGRTRGSYHSRLRAVGNVKWSESPVTAVPPVPVADPLMSAANPPEHCAPLCPDFARPITPPCVEPGDIIIPDCVW